MKVKFHEEGEVWTEEYKAVWYDMSSNEIQFIDQRLLPEQFELFKAKDYSEVAYAISEMVVRGAPAIGATAAFGVAQEVMLKHDEFKKDNTVIQEAIDTLRNSRPTANDLFYAIDYMLKALETPEGLEDPVSAAEKYVEDIVNRCVLIGNYGEKLIKSGSKVLTHCNAGALATVDYGTALAPFRAAKENGKDFFVFVDETRPRLQGSRLTAWELYNEDIDHAIIADNAAGFFIKKGEIDLVIVGADRIARNGDAANKIGTYEKAVLAHENKIPFYIAAPISTFDFDLENGDEIPIEERREDEVLVIRGTRISCENVKAYNPAFDVTPAKYITGIITEEGIFKPKDVNKLKKKMKAA
jgi:translation initiation factor eIF-2B subunit alpha/methylthioribose-1-phosphate isomerase